MNLLIVDDDLLLCETMAAIFEDTEINVEIANNGAAAYSLLHNASFDVMITDLVMPDIDGFELIKRIRAKNKKLRIIMMSGLIDPAEMESFNSANNTEIEYILTKPFDPAQLLTLISDNN